MELFDKAAILPPYLYRQFLADVMDEFRLIMPRGFWFGRQTSCHTVLFSRNKVGCTEVDARGQISSGIPKPTKVEDNELNTVT